MTPANPPSSGPLVSVVMPVFNAEKHLGEAIASILTQTHAHFEFIIVDDGSTDGSAALISAAATRDARIRPIFATHGGRGRAANLAISAAKGDLIARMDADDVSLPHRLETQIGWLRDRSLDVCGSNAKQFEGKSSLMWFPESHEAVRLEMLFRCAILQPTVLMKAGIARENLYDEQVPFEDYELWTRLAPVCRMGNAPHILHRYRHHPKQSHIMEATEFGRDLSQFSQRLFTALFPDTPPKDAEAFAVLVEKRPAPSLAWLERSGKCLAKLTQTEDSFLVQRMAERWRAACIRSAHLGLGCFRLYRLLFPKFGLGPPPLAPALFLASVLRLRHGSGLKKNLSRLKRTLSVWPPGTKA